MLRKNDSEADELGSPSGSSASVPALCNVLDPKFISKMGSIDSILPTRAQLALCRFESITAYKDRRPFVGIPAKLLDENYYQQMFRVNRGVTTPVQLLPENAIDYSAFSVLTPSESADSLSEVRPFLSSHARRLNQGGRE